MFTRHRNYSATLALLCLGGMTISPGLYAAETFTEALTAGKTNLDIRLRYETVKDDNTAKDDATARTVRTRLGYTTADYQGFGAMIEFENVTAIPDDDKYNSTLNGNGGYSTVADPEGSEVNQAFVRYTGLSGTEVKFGRQRIILDNARFVGNVGWRQNEQTFDALSISNTSLPDIKLTYAYLGNRNSITFGDTDTKSHLLNAMYSGFKPATITAYDYMIEFKDAPTTSSRTIGLRASGGSDLGDGKKLLYTLEFANIGNYKDGASTIDADYLLAEIGGTISMVTAKLGYEVLGGDGVFAFDTPFATKHAFNGWADTFLAATPLNGLKDQYLSVSGKLADVKLLGVYHTFSADNGGDDYGTELDLLASKNFGKNYNLTFKYAAFSSDLSPTYVDTDKLWLMAGLKF